MKFKHFLMAILGFGMLLVLSCSDDSSPTSGGNRLPDFPSNPSPVDGATGQLWTVNLTWVCDDPDGDTLTYDVHFGTSLDPPLVDSSRPTMSYEPNLLNSATIYYWKVVAQDDKGGSTDGPIWSFHTCSEMVIQFPDSNLETCVRGFIDKPSGDILASDVDTLTSFSGFNWNISDLGGLEYMRALNELDLAVNSISELTPISGLTELTSLNLADNQISDLSPLAGLTKLSLLNLGWDDRFCFSVGNSSKENGHHLDGNLITDLSPLAGLTELSRLDLCGNQISDLSPLSSLTSLTDLYLRVNQINDFSPLSNLTALTLLDLGHNEISNLTPLIDLTGLTSLTLDYNQISDLTSLSNLTALTRLSLDANQITDILPLVENPGMDDGDWLHLTENSLSDTSINVYIPELEARGVMVYY